MSEYTVGEECGGILLRAFLHRLGISRAELIRLKKRDGGILVNGGHATVRRVLESGDVVSLAREDTAGDENVLTVPTEMKLDIIYEDDDVIAVNKPPDTPTHTSHGHFTDTLENGVAYYYKSRGIPFVFRACNRLDRDTSGVVLIAKNKGTAYRMSKLISDGRADKKYVCIAEGDIDGPITVRANIKRERESIIKRVVCGEDEGQSAETLIEPLSSGRGRTFCLCTPVTGRTHQIRVHLSYIGHPIVGDTLYGREETEAPRQMLHCVSLGIGGMLFRADLPDDMKKMLDEDEIALAEKEIGK